MEEYSRQIVGTSLMAYLISGMVSGDIEITGSAPSNKSDREVFYGTGKTPHAIKIGDE